MAMKDKAAAYREAHARHPKGPPVDCSTNAWERSISLLVELGMLTPDQEARVRVALRGFPLHLLDDASSIVHEALAEATPVANDQGEAEVAAWSARFGAAASSPGATDAFLLSTIRDLATKIIPPGASGMSYTQLVQHLLGVLAGGSRAPDWGLYTAVYAAWFLVRSEGPGPTWWPPHRRVEDSEKAAVLGCLAWALLRQGRTHVP
jgi:hypothetical protein